MGHTALALPLLEDALTRADIINELSGYEVYENGSEIIAQVTTQTKLYRGDDEMPSDTTAVHSRDAVIKQIDANRIVIDFGEDEDSDHTQTFLTDRDDWLEAVEEWLEAA